MGSAYTPWTTTTGTKSTQKPRCPFTGPSEAQLFWTDVKNRMWSSTCNWYSSFCYSILDWTQSKLTEEQDYFSMLYLTILNLLLMWSVIPVQWPDDTHNRVLQEVRSPPDRLQCSRWRHVLLLFRRPSDAFLCSEHKKNQNFEGRHMIDRQVRITKVDPW